MKLSRGEQESIVGLLTRIYHDICELETQFRLLIGEGDFRPRIDYFHDAVRAFTNANPKERESGGRLSVEYLAYDISCLRYIHAMPLAPFKPHAANLSPSTEIIKLDQQLAPMAVKPGRVEKERIAELYQRYGVLFAALLKPLADSDFNERADDLNHDVEHIHTLQQKCEAVLEGKGRESDIEALLGHLDDETLRLEVLALLRGKGKGKDEIKKLIQLLKERSKAKDKEIAGIEAAHLNYALGQLAIYEESKDMVKKLAQQGMNLVGKFVESSIAETKREMGR